MRIDINSNNSSCNTDNFEYIQYHSIGHAIFKNILNDNSCNVPVNYIDKGKTCLSDGVSFQNIKSLNYIVKKFNCPNATTP